MYVITFGMHNVDFEKSYVTMCITRIERLIKETLVYLSAITLWKMSLLKKLIQSSQELL